MAVTKTFLGFEVGDISEFPTTTGTFSISSATVITGGYSLRTNPTTSALGAVQLDQNDPLGFSSTHPYINFKIRVATAPASNNEPILEMAQGLTLHFELRLSSTKTIDVYGANGLLSVAGTTVLNLNQNYTIQLEADVTVDPAPFNLYINGILESSGNVDINSASSTITRVWFGKHVNRNSQTIDVYFDDIIVANSEFFNYLSKVIARQPKTGGSPSSDGWSKSSGTDAGPLWDETPFDASTNCFTSAAAAQTADVAAFSATQTPHGNEVVSSADTISSANVYCVCKRTTGGSTTHQISYKLDTAARVDVTISPTTSDTLRISGFFNATFTEIENAEVGGNHSGAQTLTFEDMWFMLLYVPGASFPPYRSDPMKWHLTQ